MAYPGLSLGIPVFTKQKVSTFRESFKHAQLFVGLTASSLKMIREHQNQY